MVLRQEAFNQICVHKGLCVFEEKQANLMKSVVCWWKKKDVAISCSIPMYLSINICHKKSFAIDVLFLQSVPSLGLVVEGWDYQSNNRKAGAKSLILITCRFYS